MPRPAEPAAAPPRLGGGALRHAGRAPLAAAGAVGAAAVAAVGAASVGALALLAVLPWSPSGALAARLPLLIAAAAFGGRTDVSGPLAGRVSIFNDYGLLGPLAPRSGGSGQLAVALVPATVSLLAVAAAALAVARHCRRHGPRAWAPVSAGVVAGCAGVAAALAAASRVQLDGGTVGVSVGAAALGGAAAGAAAAVGGGLGLARARWPVVGVAAARLAWLAAGSALVGVVVGIAGLIADRHGTVGGLVGTLLVGQPLSIGLCVVLALLFAPAFGWYGLSLALGAPVAVSGNALHLSAHRTVTIETAARAAPVLAFAPVVAAAAVLGLVALGGRGSGRGRQWWAGWIAAHAVGFAALGLVMRSVSLVGVQRVVGAAPDEVGLLVPTLWASAVVPAVWGVLVAVALPRRAAPA